MKRIVNRTLFALLLAAVSCSEVKAQTINAASCNQSDVQAAFNLVTSSTTTLTIPSGKCTWTTGATLTVPAANPGLTIQGQTTCTGSGDPSLNNLSCVDSTTIIDGINRGTNDIPTMAFSTNASTEFRLTGLTLQTTGASNTLSNNGMLTFSGMPSVRVDHFHINLGIARELPVDFGDSFGVIDHCLFNIGERGVDVTNGNWVISGTPENPDNGDTSWADSSYFGSSKFLFIEANTFINESPSLSIYANDCEHGGRFVFRYNTTNAAGTMTHEFESQWRGCRAFEIYDNAFNNTTGLEQYTAFFDRMATGLIWGNTSTDFVHFVYALNDRSDQLNGSWGSTPTYWGACGNTYGPSAWDENTDSTGYPCLDQIGRGKGDLLNGMNFPNRLNTVTGTIAWPHQSLEPQYSWANTYNPAPQNSADSYWSNQDAVIVENRDYYVQLPNYDEPSATFNGTAGVGQGSAAPTTGGAYTNAPNCTPYVGYWDATNETLYQCSAKNTWTVYYTPYVYPHPLDTSGTAPNAPTNLVAAGH